MRYRHTIGAGLICAVILPELFGCGSVSAMTPIRASTTRPVNFTPSIARTQTNTPLYLDLPKFHRTPAVPKRLPRQVRPVRRDYDPTHKATKPPAPPPPPQPVLLDYYNCVALESLWDSVGGNPAAAFMAAEIATAESGGRPGAISPTNDYGLWQVNGSWGSLASLNAIANAKAAVYISHNGTNWNPWTTYTSGAYAGRC